MDHSEGLDQPREGTREGTPSRLKLQARYNTEMCLSLTGKREKVGGKWGAKEVSQCVADIWGLHAFKNARVYRLSCLMGNYM